MNISHVKNCTGCLACVNRCPKNCINIREDKFGYKYPQVNDNTCIDCSLCIKVCPNENPTELYAPKEVYAIQRKEEKLRLLSSSGGMASVLAEYIIENDGVVYGCAFIPPFSFKHIRCTTIEQVEKLRGSKYIQSDTTDIYKTIAKDIKENKLILFIGTPCQIAALRNFFPKASDLYTVDLICHGAPSQKLLRESIPHSALSKDINQVIFRTGPKYNFIMKKGTSVEYSRPLYQDLYLKGFFTGLFYRDSCYRCQYAGQLRTGDLTLGDFWGIKLPEIKNIHSEGISLCLVNNIKGEYLIDKIADKITKHRRPLTDAIANNKQLVHPMKKTLRTKIFRYLYPILGFKLSVIFSIPEIVLKNIIFHKQIKSN